MDFNADRDLKKWDPSMLKFALGAKEFNNKGKMDYNSHFTSCNTP